jgi:NADH-quinone oxidoreductase subunit L
VLAVLGYVGAFMTAIYTFRMIFRAFHGEMCPEARELEHGHMAHPDPVNPMTGEPEDTDIGFPGPEHHIAERDPPMKVAMAILAVLSIVGGLVQVPGVDEAVTHFLEGSFEDSTLYNLTVPTGTAWFDLLIGGVISITGIGLAYWCYVADPGVTLRWRDRAGALYGFLVHRWYWDELLDALVYRPVIAAGRFANAVIERFVVNGIVAGTVGAVRGAGAVVRGAQSGFVRAYALLLVGGFAGLGLYFLLVSS